MVEIGGKPMLWHIMKMYAAHGITDFVVCLGYKGYVIKEYFANYHLHVSDVTFDLGKNKMEVRQTAVEPWKVTLIDTGDATQTGGRLKRALGYVDGDFCFTYGDGVSDVDITALIEAHRAHRKIATITTVQPPGRFGAVELSGERVTGFREKPLGDGGWINGGFFVLTPEVDRYLEGDDAVWEEAPLEALAEDDELVSYKHAGFWHAMDTLRDKRHLQALWDSGKPPWKSWS